MNEQRDLRRSQNFIRDEALIERLVARSGIGPADLVYDLGAGTGNLTAALARRARSVVAVEKDPALAETLRRRFRESANVTVREADLFSQASSSEDHVVFANPPFDRTADLLARLTEAETPPRLAVLVLQREAADRYLGRPRTTLRSALLAPHFEIDLLHRFARTDFVPRPSVDAVLVALRKRDPPLVAPSEAQLYRDLVVACFVAGRSIFDPSRRATDLTHDEWLTLYRRFRALPRSVRRAVFGAEARLAREQARQRKIHRTREPRDALPRSSPAETLPERARPEVGGPRAVDHGGERAPRELAYRARLRADPLREHRLRPRHEHRRIRRPLRVADVALDQ